MCRERGGWSTGVDSKKDLLYAISDEDEEAYETYVALTTYENVYKNNKVIENVRKDYANRDSSFPVDLVMRW